MLPNLSYGEIFVILVVALLVFGAKRIPEIARSIGRAVNSFKAGLKDEPGGPRDDSSAPKNGA